MNVIDACESVPRTDQSVPPCGPRWVFAAVVLAALVAAGGAATAQERAVRPATSVPGTLIVDFSADPLQSPEARFEGDAFERVTWEASAPRFPGDAPGHVTALYRSNRPAGRVGWPLPRELGQDDTFTAAAVIELDPDHFRADPMGFFQISWGLWNAAATGLDRSGGPEADADSYQLVEWDYFPNVSPFFGGPFLSPGVFGVKLPGDPDAFANFSFASVETTLPLGVPLLTAMEHRAGQDAVVVSVHEIRDDGSLMPVDGAVAVVPLGWLVEPEYALDRAGLTLWRNGFEEPGGEPQLDAKVDFHLLAVREGRIVSPEELMASASGGSLR